MAEVHRHLASHQSYLDRSGVRRMFVLEPAGTRGHPLASACDDLRKLWAGESCGGAFLQRLRLAACGRAGAGAAQDGDGGVLRCGGLDGFRGVGRP